MTLLREIEWEAPLIEPYRDPDAEALMRKKYGFVMDSVASYSRSPWIVRSQVHFDIQRDVLVHVDVNLAEIIGLVVSQDNSCRFCYAAWRALLRIEENLAAALSPSDRVAVDFARRVSRANPIPSRAEWKPLEAAGIEPGAIKELAFLAALNVYYNRLATLLAVPTTSIEEAGKNARLDWARPVLGWKRRGTATAATPALLGRGVPRVRRHRGPRQRRLPTLCPRLRLVTAVAMPSSAFLAVRIGAVVAALGYAFWRARAEAKHLRRRLESATTSLEQLQLSFARFAPQEVVERIIASGVSTSAEKKTVTVLVADIVGFTALSEGMEPALLVQILNGYFARMGRAIAEHRGHVSKFIGDGILALFGALEPNSWQADDAVRAALAMREALEEYNEELARAGQPPLRVGIGLHRGVAVAGVIGSEELVEFTVIGSTVNLASRVEHLTRRHAADTLITAAVREALDARFALQELPAAAVAGISEPVVTFAVEGVLPG